jgi:hypothetical protein
LRPKGFSHSSVEKMTNSELMIQMSPSGARIEKAGR